MITYDTKTQVWLRLWVTRPAVDTAIRKWQVKKIILKRWKKDIKFYVIVKETIIELLK